LPSRPSQRPGKFKALDAISFKVRKGEAALLVLWVTMAIWIATSLMAAFFIFTFQDIR